VQQSFGLVGHGLDDMGVAVASGIYGNAGGKIKKEIAVDIMNPETFGLIGNQGINPGVGRRDKRVILFD
jgi:hypothetical protein